MTKTKRAIMTTQHIIDRMTSAGCKPDKHDIIIDDRKHRFKPEGDKNPNGEYCFKLCPDGAVIGWFKNYKEGFTHNYSSRTGKEYTEEEKASFKAQMDQGRKERNERLKKDRAAAAEKADEIWGKAKRGDHPYLSRKIIEPLGSRVSGLSLIVPVYKRSKLTSLQFIKQDGSKRFLKNGDIKGGYASVNARKDFSRIYICEGYATAGTIWKAMGCPVIVAFNAGNLEAVAKIIRKKYPDAEIIIAGDDDQWTPNNLRWRKSMLPEGYDEYKKIPSSHPVWTEWRDNLLLKNSGMIYAEKTAKAVSGLLVFPDFPSDDEKKRTDFNDYDNITDVKNRLQTAERLASSAGGSGKSFDMVAREEDQDPSPSFDDTPPPEDISNSEPPIEAYEDEFCSKEVAEVKEWRDLIITDGKGEPVKNSLKNTELFLQHLPDYKGIFRYNEFSHQICVCRCPIWEDESKFKVHALNDIDITQTAAATERQGLSPDTVRTHKAVQVVANNNGFHPAQDYFNSLKWDGVERLEGWLTYYLGAEYDEPEYLSFIGKKWLTAAVKRIMQPGCKFDHILVMEGAQGGGKSTSLEELATFGDAIKEHYFTDAITIADIQNKDTIQKIQGSVIVELAELAGFSKKDDEEIKRWITLKYDDCRLPYERTVKRFERQFVLSATTNSYDYLKDPTGNRRFWPFKVGKIDMHALKNDREKLWSEAVYWYRQGLYIGPTPEESKLAEIAQEKRRSIDSWESDVMDAVEQLGFELRDGFKTERIMADIGLGIKDRTMQATRRVSTILRQNDFISKNVKRSGKQTRIWVRNDD